MSNFNYNFSTSKIKAPCQGCAQRCVGCRETCEAWQKYQELKDEEEANKRLKFSGYRI